MMRFSLITLLALCLLNSTYVYAALCPDGDINGDCGVDCGDLLDISGQWLTMIENCVSPGCADLDDSNFVDLRDFSVLSGGWGEKVGPVVINEFMASNSNLYEDPNETGEYPDWIEVYNVSSLEVDLWGMYLTDDSGEPTQWQIPQGISIGPREFVVFIADGEDGQGIFHTNFQLSADGEEVGIYEGNEGIFLDIINYKNLNQTADISYGRYPDGNDVLRFFATPTPGYGNEDAYLGEVADTKFSHDRGFYEDANAFDLVISCATEGAQICYMTDGSEPNLINGLIFDSNNPIHINSTSTIRAAAFKPGWLETNVDTHSYIFLDDVITQATMDQAVVAKPAYSGIIKDALKSIPTLSIVMNWDDMFGIGGAYYTSEYEKETSIELIYGDGRDGFQTNCGVQRHSNASPKTSLRLEFKSEYGDASLNHAFFESAPLNSDTAVEQFDRLILRSGKNQSWTNGRFKELVTYVEDQWVRDSQIAMSGIGSHGTFVHLYINGVYWGLYNPVERPDAWFTSSYYGGDMEDYLAVNFEENYPYYNHLSGDKTRFHRIVQLAGERNLEDPAKFAEFTELVDIEKFADYVILFWYSGFGDGVENNWYGGMRNEPPDAFEYYMWDGEFIFLTTAGPSGYESAWVPPYFFNSDLNHTVMIKIWQALIELEDFQMLFADRVYKHCFNGGALTDESCRERLSDLSGFIYDAIIGESARWGGGRTRDNEWLSAVAILDWKMDGNTQIFINTLRDWTSIGWPTVQLYPDYDPPIYNHPSGVVDSGTELAIEAQVDTNSTVEIPLIEAGSVWKYVDDGCEPDPRWARKTFRDSSWRMGAAQLGYGDGDEATEVRFGPNEDNSLNDPDNKFITTYFRKHFEITDKTQYLGLNIDLLRDDGAVVYLNGVELLRDNMPETGEIYYDTLASSTVTSASGDESRFFKYSVVESELDEDENVLAVEIHQRSLTSSDISFDLKLNGVVVNPHTDRRIYYTTNGLDPRLPGGAVDTVNAVEYTSPIVLNESTVVKSRLRYNGYWSALQEGRYGIGPVKENLRITEIMYHPVEPNEFCPYTEDDFEYIELKNISGTETINLGYVEFADGIDFTFDSLSLSPEEYVVVVKNQSAFEWLYGSGVNVAGEYDGRLDNGGENVELHDAAGQVILSFRYEDGWYDITDGTGFSLTVKDAQVSDPNEFGDKSIWRPSAAIGGSPAFDDSGVIPELGSIKINEFLAHSPDGNPDWVEFYNTTDMPINIGGWFISDSGSSLSKYEIAEGTIIDMNDYIVFYEDVHFGNSSNPGCHSSFALSNNGETVYLHSGLDGVLTGYSEEEKFGASEPNISFGRYPKSTGTYNFVAMNESTPGGTNSYPKVGPIVINEIMYHPAVNSDAEYVELLNISAEPVILYDYVLGAGWRFVDDADDPDFEFYFPGVEPVILSAGEYVLLVKDLAAFDSEFDAAPGVRILEWSNGSLSNGGEKVELSLPGEEDGLGGRYYIRIDRVNYSDGSHPEGGDPWPGGPDGEGWSLSRKVSSEYGNDVINWQSAVDSPGSVNP